MTSFLRDAIDHLAYAAEAGEAPEDVARSVLPNGPAARTWGEALDALIAAGVAGFETHDEGEVPAFRSTRLQGRLRVIGGEK